MSSYTNLAFLVQSSQWELKSPLQGPLHRRDWERSSNLCYGRRAHQHQAMQLTPHRRGAEVGAIPCGCLRSLAQDFFFFFFGHTRPGKYILPPAATQEADMAEHMLPHPKSTDPDLDPKASSSTVTSSPRFCLECLRRAFSPFFLGLSGLRRLGELSSRGSKPPHHFLLILTLFSHSSVLKQETQATVFTNLSSSPCP